jgi:hypothetical protein
MFFFVDPSCFCVVVAFSRHKETHGNLLKLMTLTFGVISNNVFLEKEVFSNCRIRKFTNSA